MVLIFKSISDWWRERLASLDLRLARGGRDYWVLKAERKVLVYLLRRHAEMPQAEAPQSAVPLDKEDAERSNSVYLFDEAEERRKIAAQESIRKNLGLLICTGEEEKARAELFYKLFPVFPDSETPEKADLTLPSSDNPTNPANPADRPESAGGTHWPDEILVAAIIATLIGLTFLLYRSRM